MKRGVLIVLTVAGIALGVWHLRLASQAISVFGSGEPLTSWIAMLCGPVSTLPAVVLSLFRRRTGGGWLVAGSLVSLVAFVLGEGRLTEDLFPFLWSIATPMLLIGVAMIILTCKEVDPCSAERNA
jgi:hypothetical protein